MSLQTVLQELRMLAPPDVERVKLEASALLSLSPCKRVDVTSPKAPPISPILDGITHELKRRGLVASGFSDRTINRLYPGAIEAAAELQAHLYHRLDLKPAEWAALGRAMARALADWLEPAEAGVSARRMFQNIDKMLTALEHAFPGYLSSGLLPFLWDKAGKN